METKESNKLNIYNIRCILKNLYCNIRIKNKLITMQLLYILNQSLDKAIKYEILNNFIGISKYTQVAVIVL